MDVLETFEISLRVFSHIKLINTNICINTATLHTHCACVACLAHLCVTNSFGTIELHGTEE